MIVKSIFKWISFTRMKQLELMQKYPVEFQNEQFVYLISKGKNTLYGKKYGFSDILSYNDFSRNVPVVEYDDIKPYINRMFSGEENILWPGKVKWFAKSSGTTSDKSKFIPVTDDSLKNNHYKGGKDIFSVYVNEFPNTKIFNGKALSIGGSNKINNLTENSYYGDLSSILIQNLPFWAEFNRVPSLKTALLEDWQLKLEKITREAINENVTTVAGVPSWVLNVFNYILNYTGKNNLLEVWPNFELFIHGGVSFEPYKKLFAKILPSKNVNYLETYNASEGFFAIQTSNKETDMMLMLDYKIFYEFIEFDDYVKKDFHKTIPLEGVKKNKNYVIIITTNGGLWRYIIGDTVEFTSLYPHKINLTGRIQYYINVFGEELMQNNVEMALKDVSKKMDVVIKEYTVAPVFIDEKNKQGMHEWVIEFEKPPSNLSKFVDLLDEALKLRNSDYEAKRYKDLTLKKPIVHIAPPNTFYKWLSMKGKLGGQNKVPRLLQERKLLEEILLLINGT